MERRKEEKKKRGPPPPPKIKTKTTGYLMLVWKRSCNCDCISVFKPKIS
jgi:hypothetical protein